MPAPSAIPMFKYFGHGNEPLGNGALKVLQNLSLKVTPPVEFNDPFEFTPVVKGLPPDEDAKNELKRVLTDPAFFDANRSEFPQCRNFSQFQSVIRGKLGELTKGFSESTERMNFCFQQEVSPSLSKTYGVVCFSATPIQPLMWAHYGAAHTGLVLEFDGSCPLFSDPGFLQVDYATERAEFDPDLPDRARTEALARRKSLDWAYEKEFRLVVSLSRTKRISAAGADRNFLPIEPSWIKSITVGLRASFELKGEVMRLRRQPQLAHLGLYRISMNQHAFAFDRNQVRHF